jgi:hypothetical protein
VNAIPRSSNTSLSSKALAKYPKIPPGENSESYQARRNQDCRISCIADQQLLALGLLGLREEVPSLV